MRHKHPRKLVYDLLQNREHCGSNWNPFVPWDSYFFWGFLFERPQLRSFLDCHKFRILLDPLFADLDETWFIDRKKETTSTLDGFEQADIVFWFSRTRGESFHSL
jgi:hypothetical protein